MHHTEVGPDRSTANSVPNSNARYLVIQACFQALQSYFWGLAVIQYFRNSNADCVYPLIQAFSSNAHAVVLCNNFMTQQRIAELRNHRSHRAGDLL